MSDDLLELFQMSNISDNSNNGNENCENSRSLPRPSINRRSSGNNSKSTSSSQSVARVDVSEADGETAIETPFDEGNTVSYHEIMREEYEVNDTRIAMIGNVDSGKSTLIGVLTNRSLDDGRGVSYLFVYFHHFIIYMLIL